MSILFFVLAFIVQTIRMIFISQGENYMFLKVLIVLTIILYLIYFVLFLINFKNDEK
jgi:hypothetical protein